MSPLNARTTTEEPTTEPRKRKPLTFSVYGFELRDWERDRIHRYSVRQPAWWRWWLKLRELGARVGIR